MKRFALNETTSRQYFRRAPLTPSCRCIFLTGVAQLTAYRLLMVVYDRAESLLVAGRLASLDVSTTIRTCCNNRSVSAGFGTDQIRQLVKSVETSHVTAQRLRILSEPSANKKLAMYSGLSVIRSKCRFKSKNVDILKQRTSFGLDLIMCWWPLSEQE